MSKAITSAEELHGKFLESKIWPFYIGLYTLPFAAFALINKFYLLAVPVVLVFAAAVYFASSFKNGIKIDEIGSLYLIKMNKETLIPLDEASEIWMRYYSRLRRNDLVIEFKHTQPANLPAKVIINASKLRSAETKKYLDPAVLSDFLKAKCTGLGFLISEKKDEALYTEWSAIK